MINNYDIDLNWSELSSSNNSIKKIQDYSIDINRDNNLNYRKKSSYTEKTIYDFN